MDLLNAWKSDQNVLLNKTISDLIVVKKQNIEIQKTNKELEKSIEFINQAYENLNKSVEKLQNKRKEHSAHIAELERKVIDLQHYSRSSSFEIRNIPYAEKESTEDLESVVLRTCEFLQLPLLKTDLRDVYRMPGKRETNRPIVAETVKVYMKKRVLVS